MNVEISVVVQGKVQGVGMRFFALRAANELGVLGYVKNMQDGSVEIRALAPESTLKTFIEKIEKGPDSANIKDISVEWDKKPQKKFDSFEIR